MEIEPSKKTIMHLRAGHICAAVRQIREETNVALLTAAKTARELMADYGPSKWPVNLSSHKSRARLADHAPAMLAELKRILECPRTNIEWIFLGPNDRERIRATIDAAEEKS